MGRNNPSKGSKGEDTATRPNPVALEAQVSVTGARPGETSGSGDLFSEDTHTVVVFKDGAVLEMASAVSVGQLLFLMLKKSKEEVVCQVLRKRVYKPTTCYVELQFTEDRPDFWGVAFPEGTQSSGFAAAKQVEFSETTEDDQGGEVEPHSEEDVAALKKEVEVSRRKLQALEQAKAPEETWKVEEKTLWPAEEKPAEAVTFSKEKLELAPVNEPSPEAPAVKAPEGKETTEKSASSSGQASAPARSPGASWWQIASEEKKEPTAADSVPGKPGGEAGEDKVERKED